MLAIPALGDEAVMTRPIQAASLHGGPLDMVSYWAPLEDEEYELTATFGREARRPFRCASP